MDLAHTSGPVATGQDEGRRAEQRHDVAQKRAETRLDTSAWIAMIVTPEGKQIPCSLKDVSRSGARIGVPERVALPEEFRIKIMDRDFTAHVVLMWRRGDYVGVRIGQITRTSVDAALAENAARVAAEIAELDARRPEAVTHDTPLPRPAKAFNRRPEGRVRRFLQSI